VLGSISPWAIPTAALSAIAGIAIVVVPVFVVFFAERDHS
jgi:hypothetical protein